MSPQPLRRRSHAEAVHSAWHHPAVFTQKCHLVKPTRWFDDKVARCPEQQQTFPAIPFFRNIFKDSLRTVIKHFPVYTGTTTVRPTLPHTTFKWYMSTDLHFLGWYTLPASCLKPGILPLSAAEYKVQVGQTMHMARLGYSNHYILAVRCFRLRSVLDF